MARSSLPVPAIPTNSFVASASAFTGANAPRMYVGAKEWQKEAYRHLHICGEARFAATFFAHAVGRARLRVATMQPGGPDFVEQGDAVDVLESLYTGPHGQAEMLAQIGLHLTVAGECYVIGRSPTPDEILEGVPEDEDVWEVVSVLEVKVTGKKWSIEYGEGRASIELKDDDAVIRVWTPAPERRVEADSPFRSLLPILMEIEWLTRRIFAENSSRLAGAGLLLLPSNITFPPPPNPKGEDLSALNEADMFMLSLADAMMKPIEDPGNPAALVPVTVMVPPESIGDVRHLTFWSELSGEAKELRSEAIRRFAIGMDLPPEQVLGMSSNSGTGGGNSNGVSHWGAWQIEEATIKMHVEPMLNVVCNALTLKYLKPQLDRPAGSVMEEFITYDTTALRLRPDRSREAMELYDRGELKRKTMLEETGFHESDLPDEAEYHEWLLRKIASGSATPSQVEAALLELGITLDSARFEPSEADIVPEEETRETPLPPSLEDHPARPRTPAEEYNGALLAAAEGLVFRALEKAGNRFINAGRRGKDRDRSLVSYEVHLSNDLSEDAEALFTDAFTCAPMLLEGLTEKPEVVLDTLHDYCLDLYRTQSPHDRGSLKERLRGL